MVPVRDVVLCGDARSRRRHVVAPESAARAPSRNRRLAADNGHSRVLAIGDASQAQRLVGVLSADRQRGPLTLVAVLPLDAVERLEQTISRERPNRVILLEQTCPSADLETILEVARRSRVHLQVAGEHLGNDPVVVLPGAARPVFAVQPGRIRGYRFKRVFDVFAGCTLLVVLSPFLAVVALLTKLGSPGPAFYTSWRVGVGERSFPCYKFRTMCVGADVQQEELESRNEADGCLFKIEDDPRVTRVGRFLRRTSLDELLQLVNVVRGQMSLVGPRPLPVRDVELMPHRYKIRHAVLPGMTGLWQVSGRSGLRAVDMMELDMVYIRTWSLRADARILWRTVGVVLSRKGAF